jgi:hypothetical protein
LERKAEINLAYNDLEMGNKISTYLTKQLLDKDFILDFMEEDRRKILMKLYVIDLFDEF